jgi:hypothetical protein
MDAATWEIEMYYRKAIFGWTVYECELDSTASEYDRVNLLMKFCMP